MVSEANSTSTLTSSNLILFVFRFIVCRRVFLILGLLYGYRAITMFVTVLPRSDKNYYCSPKMAEQGKTLTFFTIAERVFTILSGKKNTPSTLHYPSTKRGSLIVTGGSSRFDVFGSLF